MRTLIILLATAIHCFGCFGIGVQSHVFIAATTEAPAAGGPSFPQLGNLAHYWSLDEAAGNNRVDSQVSLPMVEQGGTIPNASGKNGNAADLRGISSRYLECASYTLNEGFSVACWVFVDNLPASQSQLTKKSSPPGFQITLSSGGTVGYFSSDDGDTATAALGALDAWHLIVAVNDGAGVDKISIDGGTFVTADYFGTFDADSVGRIGSTEVSGSVDGLLDAVMIWSVALTQGEVTDLFNSGSGVFP